MAWKVIGYQNASGDPVGGNRPQYYKEGNRAVYFGPHPRKVWVKVPGERRARLPKAGKMPVKAARADDAIDRAKACQYAFWLAKRDGIELPEDAYGIPHFETLPNPTTGKMEKRCMFVQMRVAAKQAQKRAYDVRSTVNSSVVDLCKINIPNWSWFPAEPVETIVPLDDAFADLGKRAMATLLDCLMAA
jgi:hypothetical protein